MEALDKQDEFWYVTVCTGKKFIINFTQYSLKSLLNTGVNPRNVFCAVNTDEDKKIIKKLVPQLITDVAVVEEDLSKCVWKTLHGKRKFSLFKAAALYKVFGEPKENKYLIQFDGDVLWYKNPTEFFHNKKHKTWFHHGKGLQKRCKIPKSEINVKDYNSLKHWIDPAWAYLFIKYGLSYNNLPDREVVAGLYLLHPRDHKKVLEDTYKGCKIISRKFKGGEGKYSVGEQKPFNAALCKWNIDWHGGSKFRCPEHKEYFDHFFGSAEYKTKFHKKVKKMGL